MAQALTDELFDAIRAGDEARVASALAAGADVNASRAYRTSVDRDVYEGTESPLMAAVSAGKPHLARLLLERGAKPDTADELTGRTPLVEAAARGQGDVVEALLGAGANVAARDGWSNENALTAAIAAGSRPIAKRLVEAGAPLEPRALDAASRLGREDLAELVVEAGHDPNTTDALATAATYGQLGMLRWLVAHGLSLGAKGPQALHNAANGGKSEAVRALVALGVPVEARTSYGWTPLHIAAYNGDADTVRALLEAGADASADDGTGKNPLDWAHAQGKTDNAALLAAAQRSKR
jgi:ankyrin repeat protein